MKRFFTFAIITGLLAAPAAAQEDLLNACGQLTLQSNPAVYVGPSIDEEAQYLCGQVVGVLTTVQPSVGIAFTGGNHVLGTATTMGRRLGVLPRVSVTARANGTLVDMPDLLDGFNAELGSDQQIPALGSDRAPLGSLQGDVAIGLFNGFSVGPALGGLGAVDLLGSLSFVPTFDEIGLTEDIINWGVGARIGILKQGLVVPGVSVSGMYRDMGEVRFGDLGDGDPAEFATDLSTLSLRAAVSKGILALDVAAGAGYDIYSSDVSFDFELVCPAEHCTPRTTFSPATPVAGELKTAAWNVHGNVGLSLLLLNIVAELGYQKATDVVTAEDLQEAGLPNRAPAIDDLEDGRLFGGVGIRLTF